MAQHILLDPEPTPSLRERVEEMRFSAVAHIAAGQRGVRLESLRSQLLQHLTDASTLARELAAVAGGDDDVAAVLEALA
jgi:hypothetical protein